MPFAPEVEAFLTAAAQDPQPRLYVLSPAEARAQMATVNDFVGAGPEVASVTDFEVSGAGTQIKARLYEPVTSRATIVWFHGGGWVLGDLDSHDAMCRMLTNASECSVLGIDYRLSPEFPFPTPLEDCWAALQWAGKEYSGKPLVVGGDSAGGNLAAVCAVRARDYGGPKIALQVLVYPVTDHDMGTASYIEHGGEDTLVGKKEMAWLFDHYVPDGVDRSNPDISPLRTPDLSGLPPAIVVTAEYDPLRDEGRDYAKRLSESGVPVTAHHYDGMIHGFFTFLNIFPTGNATVEKVGGEISAALGAA